MFHETISYDITSVKHISLNNNVSTSPHNLMSVFFKLVLANEDHRHESREILDNFFLDLNDSDTSLSWSFGKGICIVPPGEARITPFLDYLNGVWFASFPWARMFQ